jgi:transposase
MSTVSFEQVILRGCGLDVHKDVVVATISGEGLSTETRSYKTFSSSLTELKEWLLSNGITHAAMESTGVYWKPVYKVLECPRMKVWVVNARHIKYVPGHKTDKKDSAWICKLLLAGLLKPSYIPEREQRELRDLTRYRNKLIQHVSSDKNRIVRILEDCNIKLSSVMSHLDGVVATKLIDILIDKGHVTMDDIACVYHKRLEASPELLYQACEGFIEPHHTYMLQTIRKDIEQTESIISDLTSRIKEVLSPYENVIELLRKIPGLDRKTVEDLIAEIGVDMEVFPTEKHLASWAGICPGNNESAGKKKWKNHSWQQTVESRYYGGSLGSHPYQEHILQRTLPPFSRP